MSHLLMLFFITIACASSNAQIFGGHPPSQKWMQIKSKEARVIFPAGRDSAAMRVANVFHAVSTTSGSTIGNKLSPISVVMQHQTTIPNGYVGLGPWRSEFYLTPSSNSFELGSLLWYDQLAIHEFRHVEQFSNFNVGLSKVFGILFGQQGRALANSVAVPNWFFEGDAVYNETFASTQGRGRMPYFFNGYRSLWEANKNYSWLKLRNGSLRDYVPDHYQLGYMEVAYGREKYGSDFWKTVTHDAAAYKGLFYPFQKAIKKQTGISYANFRNDAINYFKKPVIEKAATTQLSLPKHFNADEEYPVFTENGSLIYVRSSYKQIPSFMIREEGIDRKIRAKDVSLDNYFSYRNGRIAYASYRPDLRWGWKDYSELQVLDIFTGKQKTITRKSKYFSPDIDEEGKKIVAVYLDEKGHNGLHLLSAVNGEILSAFAAKENMQYTYPKFYTNDQIITAVRNGKGEMALMKVDLAQKSETVLIDLSEMVIGFPLVRNDTVYFTGSLKERDRIFAYAIKSGELFQLPGTILKQQTGYYQPAVNDSVVGFSNFTATGFRFETISQKDIQWEAVSKAELETPAGDFNVHSLSVANAGFLEKVTDSNYTVSKYSKAHKLFNFHSLLPLIDDPNYSVSIIGENVLNTLQSELFFTYNRNEQYKKLGFSTVFGGLFPYLNAGINYTIDRTGLYHNNRIYWNETELRLGFRVPLTLNKGRTITGLSFGSNYVYNNPSFRGVYKDSLGNRSFGYFDNTVSFNNQIQKARQHIYPRLAQTISLNYKTAVQRYEGQQFLATGSLYWPGLFINHNFIVNLAFQKRDSLQEVRFSNNFPFSRGYTAENLYTMFKWGVNYHFPLVYPDWGFGGIVYFQRIRANVFYDYTTVRDFYTNRTVFKADFRSTGTEIFFDTKWWNELPVSFGVRYSRLLDRDLFGGRGPNYFEFVLPLSLIR